MSDATGGLPAGLRPMLASTGELPGDDEPGWAYELKWDGIRALAYVHDGQVRLVSRLGRDMTRAYPELHYLAAEGNWSRAVLDGEIVAFDPAGRPSFELLQQRMHVSASLRAARLAVTLPVTYLAFDVLGLDGQSMLTAGYASRRSALEGLGLPGPYWQVPPAFTSYRGADVLAASGEHGLEGIVAKRLDSRYEPGSRSAAWRKVKNTYRQEVVIGGWKPGEGNRSGQIGSLLIGVHGAAGELEYAGHVGTGFTAVTLYQLGQLLGPLRTGSPPFRTAIPAEHARNVTWVQPRLVAEVEFAGWTSAGRMRAASYKGLRPDKDPAEVIREPGPPQRLATIPYRGAVALHVPAQLSPAITRPRAHVEAVLAQSLREVGSAGRAALAWTWALTGTRPSPITLSLAPGCPPSRAEILAEAAAEPEGSTAPPGVPTDFRDQLRETRAVLSWLAGASDEIPVDDDRRGQLIGARDGYARTDADIRQVREQAQLGLKAFDLPEPLPAAAARHPWRWNHDWMNAAWLRGVADMLSWVLGESAASPLGRLAAVPPSRYELTCELAAADSVVLQGRPGGRRVDPARYPPPQYGEGLQAAVRWLRGEVTAAPVDAAGRGPYRRETGVLRS